MNTSRVTAFVGWALLLLVAFAALSANAFAAGMPAQWNPAQVAVSPDDDNSFLLRPGQILVAPADAAVVANVLDGTGWKGTDTRAYGITLFQKQPDKPETAAQEVLDTLAYIRKATAKRRQGPARVSPNHVFVGEAVPATADAINFMGEPRIQGGPGSSVRPAFGPKALPKRNALASDGKGARIAVLDTGMFEHEWLRNVVRAPYADDVWDVEGDGYGDNESGHGTFIAGLIQQVAPSASVYAVKVLDSHGVGDDLKVAEAMALLPAERQHRQPLARRLHGGRPAADGDRHRHAVAGLQRPRRRRRGRQPRREAPVLARRVRPGRVRRRRRGQGRPVGARLLQQPGRVGGPRRPRQQPAVDVRARDHEGRPGPRHRSHQRPVRQLRRLGGVGRHLVLHADRRRDDRPHDDAHRHSTTRRTPRTS